eukprot:TRINITY_DN22149_c0_g1_i2.p1 TRINITY_DN22149_c0_g1~~TRINITY_DN22149_c0_g1_i2.p1  ORF type:complete len:258 (-),score=104.49 TRINITY_DN22149_c0_g1_i2:136-909(-)
MKSLHRTIIGKGPVLAFLVLAALLLCATPSHALSAKTYFLRGHSDFHALLKNKRQAKFRSSWDKVGKQFSSCLKKDPDGPYAPKALYYLGRVHEELGLRSGLKSDFRHAVDYFGRVIARYPRHGWADDCLFRRAGIYVARLAEYDQARLDLARIIVEYPRSDMHAKAKTALRKLGKYDWAIAKVGGAGQPAEPESLDTVAEAAAAEAEQAPPPRSVKANAATSRPKDPSGLAHLDTVRFKSSDEYTRVVLELSLIHI